MFKIKSLTSFIQSKNMILDQAFRYITELKKQNDTMLLEGGDKVQGEFNSFTPYTLFFSAVYKLFFHSLLVGQSDETQYTCLKIIVV